MDQAINRAKEKYEFTPSEAYERIFNVSKAPTHLPILSSPSISEPKDELEIKIEALKPLYIWSGIDKYEQAFGSIDPEPIDPPDDPRAVAIARALMFRP
jgi:hypothetical protein